ncbi:MAG TPA: hypothetical protein VM529_05085, partial [Gemmata sp.]|nr:hypothetical protein [Gemmata sp.]
MTLHVSCPACGARLKAPEDRVGKKARCNKCHTSFRIPRPDEGAAHATTPAAGDDDVPMAAAVDEAETLAPEATPAEPPPPAKAAVTPPPATHKP